MTLLLQTAVLDLDQLPNMLLPLPLRLLLMWNQCMKVQQKFLSLRLWEGMLAGSLDQAAWRKIVIQVHLI